MVGGTAIHTGRFQSRYYLSLMFMSYGVIDPESQHRSLPGGISSAHASIATVHLNLDSAFNEKWQEAETFQLLGSSFSF